MTGRLTRSIKFRLTAFGLVSVLITGLILTAVYVMFLNNSLDQSLGLELDELASTGALLINGDKHATLKSRQDETSAVYLEIQSQLKKIQQATHAKYVYTMARRGNQCYFVVDATEGVDKSHIGDPYEMLPQIAAGFSGKASHDDELVTDQWGTFKSGYAPIRNSKGQVAAILGMDLPADYIAKLKRDLVLRTVIPVGLLILIMMFLSMLVLHRTLAPIQKISDLVRRISDSGGNLNHRIQTEDVEEIQELAYSVNRLFEEMGKIVADVSSKSKSLTKTIFEMVPLMNNSFAFFSQLNDSFRSMAIGSTDQQYNIDCTSDNYKKLTSVSGEIKNKTVLAKDISSKTAEIAQESKLAILDAEKHIQTFTGNVQEVINIVRELSENTRSIGESTQLIKNIAKKTNLLALNATIEAAQSGSSGFSVVAGEIRKLSEQVGETAEKIGYSLKKVGDKVEDTVKLTEASQLKISSLNESLSQVVLSFDRICDKVKEVDEKIVEIASSVDFQAREMETTEESMQKVREIAEVIAGYVAACNDDIENEVKTVKNLNTAADGINTVAEELLEAIRKFDM